MRVALRVDETIEEFSADKPRRLAPEAMRRIAENFHKLRLGAGHPDELSAELRRDSGVPEQEMAGALT